MATIKRKRSVNARHSRVKKKPDYQRHVKGRLFEFVLNDLIKKSGFSLDETFPQLNISKTKLSGRGTNHQIDVIGVFKLGIPFINPLLLVGEAKNFNKKVSQTVVQSFLGAYIDIIQFNRVRTKLSMDVRKSDIFEPRHTYCPVFFSMKGFYQGAECLMYAHGINYFSYENSAIMYEIDQLVTLLLKQIWFAKFNANDLKSVKGFHELYSLRQAVKKQSYDKNLKNLIDYLSGVNSYVGVLDKRFPIHILHKKNNKSLPLKSTIIKIDLISDTSILVRTLNNRRYGEFSLPGSFLKDYLKSSYKPQTPNRNYIENTLRQIDLVIPKGDLLVIRNLKISEDSRKAIIEKYIRISSNIGIIEI